MYTFKAGSFVVDSYFLVESSNGTGLLGKNELVKVFVGFVLDQDAVHKRSLILSSCINQ